LTGSPHRTHLEALAFPPEILDALSAYLDLLAAWNRKTNLTGARTAADRVQLLVAGVLPALPLLNPGPLLDIGSGNGSPGLVLALFRPEESAVLLEPRSRRWAFLREACRVVGRSDIVVLRQRHDEYRGAPAQNLTLRALAIPPDEIAGLALAGGCLFVFGGDPGASSAWVRESEVPLPQSRLHVFRRARFT
jgi:16S rRNA (guanine527-N7)-methyltransferase